MTVRFASASSIRRDVSTLLKPPNRLPVAEAVKKYMRVPLDGGSSLPWDDTLTPYIIEPMNCLTSRRYDAVIFVGPARTGKSLALIDGWIVYTIVCDPADFLLIQMTEDKAREHSKKRLDRTFRVSKEVSKRLSPRTNDNNVHDKTFRAGNYLKIGWPTVNIMSSSDYRFVALTDYDRFPENIDGEGDAFSLASKRTTTFMSAGMTLVESSPGREITNIKWSRTLPHEAPPTTGILSLYNRGDRRRWYWPCPHCGEYFQPIKDNMVGFSLTDDPFEAGKNAYLQCPHCLSKIEHDQKRTLNNKGVWLIEGQLIDKKGKITGNPRYSRFASFWMEGPAAAYQTWAQLVNKFVGAEQEYELTGSEETLKSVTNTDWGLPYLPKVAQEQRRSDELINRVENWEESVVPDGVRFLVATVDVQGGKKRRFVVQVVGYGEKGERWVIDRFEITQSLRYDNNGECRRIDPGSYPEDWQVLITDVLEKTYPLQHYSHHEMGIMMLGVDSGGEDGVTDNAYKFWRRCRKEGLHRKVYLFKGDGHKRSKLITKSFPDNTSRSERRAQAKGDVPLYLLQTDQLKDRISSALSRDTVGPNYIHFPDWLDESFYDELTYEERDEKGHWEKPGRGANEAFDLMVYAHALVILKGYEGVNWEKPPKWARLPDVALSPPPSITDIATEPEIKPSPETQKQETPAVSAWAPVSNSGGWI